MYKFCKFIDCLRRLNATAENIHLMQSHQIQQFMRTTLEIDDDVLAALFKMAWPSSGLRQAR